MRPIVKRARFLTIRKLVQKRKMLRSSTTEKNDNVKPGSTGNEKNIRKKQKLTMEICELKKLPIDEISKFALVNVKPLFQSLRDAVSERDRVLARCADNKLIQDVVSRFRNAHPSWKMQIQSIYSMWAFKGKFSKMMANASNSPNFLEIKRSTPPDKSVGANLHEALIQESKTTKVAKLISPQIVQKAKKYLNAHGNDAVDMTCGKRDTEDKISAVQKVDPVKRKTRRENNALKNTDLVLEVGLEKRGTFQNAKYSDVSSTKNIMARTKIPKQHVKSLEIKTGATSTACKKNVFDGQKNDTFINEMIVERLHLPANNDGEITIDKNLVSQDSSNQHKESENKLVPENDATNKVNLSSFFMNSYGIPGSEISLDNGKPQFFHNDLDIVTDDIKCDSKAKKTPNRQQRRANLNRERLKLGLMETRFSNQGSLVTGKHMKSASQGLINSGDLKTLHPSWEAKRKLTQQSTNVTAFQGHKIKFSDD